MNKVMLVFLLLLAGIVNAEESYTAGETYQEQPIVCFFEKDAVELAETYVHEGLEELNQVLVQKNGKNLCVAGVPVEFTVIKGVSVHKDKETVYVIEVMSNGIHYYVVGPRPVKAKANKRSIAV